MPVAILSSVLPSFLLSIVAIAVLLSPAVRNRMLDLPNERSLHSVPVPRTGGLGIMLGTACALAIVAAREQVLLSLALMLAVVSFLDDLRGLRPALRLTLHLASAVAALFVLGLHDSPLRFVPFLLAIGWFTNLYNFMDGADGLAGGMAVVGFGVCSAAAVQAGADSLALACAATAAAAAAFLLFNFPPAKVFMGDAGSIPLGFLAGTLGLAGWHDGAWPWWFPLLVFGPFVADASFTLLKRIARREKLSQAHRGHYYQRLVRMGLGHRRTALLEYGAMVACSVLALAVRVADPLVQALGVGTAFLLCLALAAWIDRLWALHGELGT